MTSWQSLPSLNSVAVGNWRGQRQAVITMITENDLMNPNDVAEARRVARAEAFPLHLPRAFFR